MKTTGRLVVLLTCCLILAGCKGEKGSDGTVYLRYYWPSTMISGTYDDSTPLYNIRAGTSYQISPGTYSFEYYTISGTSQYHIYGSFTLVANKGEDGGLFWKKGADGAARYYTLNCGTTNASLSKPAGDFAMLKTGPPHTMQPVPFDPALPILTRVDKIEGCEIRWEYQQKEVAH